MHLTDVSASRIQSLLGTIAIVVVLCGPVVSSGQTTTGPAPAAGSTLKVDGFERADLFVSGQEGHKAFRIPAMVVTGKGTLLAICEGRKSSFSDKGNIDLVLKRSLDAGATWEKLQVIVDDAENTAGNPCPVVDAKTGTIWLPFCRNNRQVFMTRSDDDGVTWAKPVEITADVSKPDWTWYATGPGHGVQLKSGRLLIPCDHKLNNATKQQTELYFSHVFYSDDHGQSWKLGGTVGPRTNECQAVQAEDGSVCLNMRSYHDRSQRAIAWSKDGGQTWGEVKLEEALIEPKCQASLLRYTKKSASNKSRVLFANPASTERKNMTVRLSYDDGRTWAVARVLNEGKSVYSDLAAVGPSILCLYENGEKNQYEKMTLARFTLEWLTQGKDHLSAP